MSTLYEVLEVSENASKEVIDKAYRVLAKKYHPDLQKQEDKRMAEIKMKEINEAYNILSDDIKRKEYDLELQQKKQQEIRSMEQNIKQNMQKNMNQNMQYTNMSNQTVNRNPYIRQYNNRNYREDYNNYLRNRGFKVKEKWTWKRIKDLLITLLIMSLIVTIVWFFPPTHKLLVSFYEDNRLIKVIVDIIIAIITGFYLST